MQLAHLLIQGTESHLQYKFSQNNFAGKIHNRSFTVPMQLSVMKETKFQSKILN